MIKIERLNAVRMRTNHNVDTVIHQPAGEFALFVSDILAVFNSPMDEANHQVRAQTRTGDRLAQMGSIRCCRDFRRCDRANIINRKKRDFLTIRYGEKPRRVSVAG